MALIVVPLSKLFPKSFSEKIISPKTYKSWATVFDLERIWLDGAPLGEYCDCKNKIVVERGQYSDPPTDQVFKAYVDYCQKHGFTTDCWVCGDGTTTEVCRRDHDKYPIINEWTRKPITAADVLASAPEAYGITPDNFRPQLTPIKDIMRFTNHE